MDFLTGNNMLMMERSIDFLWTKQTSILDNIANVETPGYKTKYVTFEDTLRNRLTGVPDSEHSVADYRNVLRDSFPVVRETVDESMRMDENNVNSTEQFVELSRNAYQIQFAMQAYSSDISILRSALRST